MSEREAFYQYVLNNCGCNYIKHQRAYSAFITFNCYDYQEYELDEISAKKKLAKNLSESNYLLEAFKSSQP